MPKTLIETFLHPGASHIAGRDTRIHTVLGSCVAVVAWHRQSQLGGMCHYVMPDKRVCPREKLDGRYAGDALALLSKAFLEGGIQLADCHIRLFGGGAQLESANEAIASAVGSQNIDAAKTLMQRYGLVPHAQHLGGSGHRKLIFDIANGDVWMWMHHRQQQAA